MASLRTLARVEAMVWVLIYGGLLAVVLGWAVRRYSDSAGALAASLISGGAIATAVGVVLIVIRSQLKPDNEK